MRSPIASKTGARAVTVAGQAEASQTYVERIDALASSIYDALQGGA